MEWRPSTWSAQQYERETRHSSFFLPTVLRLEAEHEHEHKRLGLRNGTAAMVDHRRPTCVVKRQSYSFSCCKGAKRYPP